MKTLKKGKLISFIVVLAIVLSSLTVLASADAGVIVKISDVTAVAGKSVCVPIQLSGNTGICGAAFTINYDENLVLTELEKGSALSDLTMTKPGKLTVNPIKIVWDGVEDDKTNGTIAVLTFTAPETAGRYDISISYASGDVVDGNLSPVTVNTVSGSITVNGNSDRTPTVSVGTSISKPGETVNVPISITSNTGICGMTLSFSYDKSLTLFDVSAGNALSSLSMTKPGKLTSNPFKVTWDGLEADDTNGVVAILTFTAPQTAGDYEISVSCSSGDIVDGNLEPVDIKLQSGKINVTNSKLATVSIDENSVTIPDKSSSSAEIIIVFYNSAEKMTDLKRYTASDGNVITQNSSNATFAKVMLWNSLAEMKPFYVAQTIDLK